MAHSRKPIGSETQALQGGCPSGCSPSVDGGTEPTPWAIDGCPAHQWVPGQGIVERRGPCWPRATRSTGQVLFAAALTCSVCLAQPVGAGLPCRQCLPGKWWVEEPFSSLSRHEKNQICCSKIQPNHSFLVVSAGPACWPSTLLPVTNQHSADASGVIFTDARKE